MKTIVLVLLIASSAFAQASKKREAYRTGAGSALGSSDQPDTFGLDSVGPLQSLGDISDFAGFETDGTDMTSVFNSPVASLEDMDALVLEELEEIDPEFIHNEVIIDDLVKQRVQPKWITRMGITPEIIHTIYPSDSEDFVKFNAGEIKVTDSMDDTKKSLMVTGVKTDVWCFVTFQVKGMSEIYRSKHEFFFPCSSNTVYTLDTLFLREMDEECLKPKLKKPLSTTVEKCMWYYKKIGQAYDFNITEMGAVNGAEMLECYVESVKTMTQQPRVEIQCVEGGIIEADHVALTRKQFNNLKKNFTHMGKDADGNTVYLDEKHTEKDVKTRVEAS